MINLHCINVRIKQNKTTQALGQLNSSAHLGCWVLGLLESKGGQEGVITVAQSDSGVRLNGKDLGRAVEAP